MTKDSVRTTDSGGIIVPFGRWHAIRDASLRLGEVVHEAQAALSVKRREGVDLRSARRSLDDLRARLVALDGLLGLLPPDCPTCRARESGGKRGGRPRAQDG